MRIGIDVSLTATAKTGLPSYARSLVEAMARVDPTDQFLLYRYVWHSFPETFDDAVQPAARNFKAARRRIPNKLLAQWWHTGRVNRDWLVGPVPDVYFSPFHSTPPRWFPRLVSVFHDVAFRVHPEFTTEVNREYCERQFERATCLADRFLTVSHYSKAEMVKHMGVAADKIDVVHEAADPFYQKVDGARLPERMARELGDAPICLYVGSVEPRKNLDSLLKAFADMQQRAPNPSRLVIAGGSGWKNESVYQAVDQLGLEGKVYFTGYVTDEELLQLYNVAAAFCYPTVYEGFGLPVIEAMACGTPVLTTRVTSIPEVGGDAVQYVDDPYDVDGLSRALEELVTEPELRRELSQKGLQRAATFSWDKAAKETLAVIHRVHHDRALDPARVVVGRDERGVYQGFYDAEHPETGSFRWMRRRGELRLWPRRHGANPTRLEITAAANFPPGEATLTVVVDGRTLGTAPLEPEMRTHSFPLLDGPLPTDRPVRLQLSCNRQINIRELGTDPRELAARFSSAVFS